MKAHHEIRDHELMGPAQYSIRVDGHLGATVLSAFPAMSAQREGLQTVLTGILDQSALHGVLADIGALGLDLIEVRQLEEEDSPRAPRA
jgi:hypothetical protein